MTNRCPVVSLHLLEPDDGRRCGELKLIKLSKHCIAAADGGVCFQACFECVTHSLSASHLFSSGCARHGHVFTVLLDYI